MSDLAEWVKKPYKEAKELFDRYYLTERLKEANGDMSATAKLIGVDRTTIYRKLKWKVKDDHRDD